MPAGETFLGNEARQYVRHSYIHLCDSCGYAHEEVKLYVNKDDNSITWPYIFTCYQTRSTVYCGEDAINTLAKI